MQHIKRSSVLLRGGIGVFAVMMLIVAFGVPAEVLAVDTTSCLEAKTAKEDAANVYIPGPPDPYVLEQPLMGVASVGDFGEYVQLVYSFALGIGGIIAVTLIMFGGVRWITAVGNESTIGEAKEIITSAVTGLLILLFSYSILVFINPKLVSLDFSVLVIPVGLSCDAPELVAIETVEGVNGNGARGCPGMAAALNIMAPTIYAAGGTVGISGGYRTIESQQRLYTCFIDAVEAGYVDCDGRPISGKTGCGNDCGSQCNLALFPDCDSKGHLQGAAVDTWFEFKDETMAAVYSAAMTSKGKASGSCNNGACEETADEVTQLKNNQEFLKKQMTASYGGETYFSPFTVSAGGGGEWWHFNFIGDCASVNTDPCESVTVPGQSSQVADNGYCQYNQIGGSETGYIYGACTNETLECPTNSDFEYTEILPGGCGKAANGHFEFANGSYTSQDPPNCVAN